MKIKYAKIIEGFGQNEVISNVFIKALLCTPKLEQLFSETKDKNYELNILFTINDIEIDTENFLNKFYDNFDKEICKKALEIVEEMTDGLQGKIEEFGDILETAIKTKYKELYE